MNRGNAMGHRTQDSGLRTTDKKIKLLLTFLPFYFLLFTLLGCASIKETAKGIAGVSTKALEDNRGSAIIKSFNYDYFTCYTKALGILEQIGAYIYEKDIKKHMIAIYVSGTDTTSVGIFFKETDAKNIQVEVSSLSTYAKELIASKLFSALELSKSLEEVETKYEK
jgi:hypothetical protein